MAHEFKIETRCLKVSARRTGNPEGKPLLAVHGWLDNLNSFNALDPYLKDYDVVAIDMPGHGYSDHFFNQGVPSVLDYVPEIKNVIDSLGWESCNYLGHSLGGVCWAVSSRQLS